MSGQEDKIAAANITRLVRAYKKAAAKDAGSKKALRLHSALGREVRSWLRERAARDAT